MSNGWTKEDYIQFGYELEDGYCPNCDDYTDQWRRYSDHERDASHDRFICIECGWEY